MSEKDMESEEVVMLVQHDADNTHFLFEIKFEHAVDHKGLADHLIEFAEEIRNNAEILESEGDIFHAGAH